MHNFDQQQRVDEMFQVKARSAVISNDLVLLSGYSQPVSDWQ